VDPLDPDVPACDLCMEVAGFRYYVKDQALSASPGQPVRILPEPGNPYDKNAVQICVDDRKIGNINRLQAPTFLKWLAMRSVAACIERLNGKADESRAPSFSSASGRSEPTPGN